ncbi:Hypothetical predicted protein [Olea europaea subsp. europaea]|uniref:Transmembrane protein n=1 Tax=Olea europaea subsp. europaea TaxID=158383 RepID=A0A8S0U345_OLEEU|nr:Hypothetical predicted protein [Olea europaea subsp. europaea]
MVTLSAEWRRGDTDGVSDHGGDLDFLCGVTDFCAEVIVCCGGGDRLFVGFFGGDGGWVRFKWREEMVVVVVFCGWFGGGVLWWWQWVCGIFGGGGGWMWFKWR